METPPGFNLEFVTAAFIGDLPLLKTLAAKFENGEGPGKVSYANLKTRCGHNALHMAALGGRKQICRYLIQEMNFNINGIDDEGETPLFAAIKKRHQPTTIFLINNGADVTKSSNDGTTPLHHAAAKGSLEILRLLISKGADIHATSREGMPLHFAALENLDTLKYLLDLGADPNCISPVYTSPLMMSIFGSFECMKLLLKAGADPNLECSDAQTTPLVIAVYKQDKKMIRYLLSAGADPNWPDLTCKTALEFAALNGYREMVELLFPVTSRIACYPDWSINGVMQHIKSKEAMELLKSKNEEAALLVRARAKEAFQKKNYSDASHWYSNAIAHQAVQGGPTDTKALSNRSLCYTLLNDGKRALGDAQTCVRLAPGWAKAHYREGAAFRVLKHYHEAAEAFSRALALDPGNEEIENAYREALAEGTKSSH